MILFDVIGGFGQDEEFDNGCTELCEKLRSNLDAYSQLSVRVRFNEWDSRWRRVARRAHLLRLRYPKPERFGIVAFCYSWGCGNGLVQYAKALQRFGLRIDCAVLCDPIYRHWYPLGDWRAMIGGYSITLPPNVLSYYGFFQRVSRPMGVKPHGPATCLGWDQIGYEHIECDDSPEWHDKCVSVAIDEARTFVGQATETPAAAPTSEALESRIESKP